MDKIEQFKQMCKDHDLTYAYSDDGDCYCAGNASEDKIREFAKQLPIEDVRRIWNEQVDYKLLEHAREPFYWR